MPLNKLLFLRLYNDSKIEKLYTFNNLNNFSMKRGIKLIFFLTGAFLLWGCYPQGPDYIEEMDIVVTKHNEEYDFTTKGTYAMPDKIVKITGSLAEGEEPDFMPQVTADKILARIAQNMTSLGYSKVDISANPDLVLAPASWETTTISYWYDYWYWWWGGYYPGWGWGGYYPPVYWTSYTTGTLLMNLVDPDQVGANGNPINQWSGAIQGILTSTYNATRVNTAIDKAFTISPYLKTN
jgi:hypothetical protein